MRLDELRRRQALIRRDLVKASLRLRESREGRKTSRCLEDSLRLALLARESFLLRFEVVEWGVRRVLRLKP